MTDIQWRDAGAEIGGGWRDLPDSAVIVIQTENGTFEIFPSIGGDLWISCIDRDGVTVTIQKRLVRIMGTEQ